MKNALYLVLAACLALLMVTPADAEWISLTGSQEGAAPEVSLVRSDAGAVTVTVDIPGLYVYEEEMEGMTFHAVRIPEAGRSLDVGFPEVPRITVPIAVPPTGRVTVRELNRSVQTLDGYIVAPMQQPITDIDPIQEFVINEKAYSGGMYPPAAVQMNAPAIRRDVRFVQVDVYPVMARASEAMMDVAGQITFEVSFSDNPGVNEKTREVGLISPELDNMYRNSYLNYDALGYEVGESRDSNIRYLIITDDDHLASIQPLADWWNRTGLKTEVLLTSVTGTTATEIKNVISTYYNDENTEYVLLVGETNEIALGNVGSQDPGDYNYGLQEGGDDFADIAVGRILQDQNSIIDHIVARTLNFIQNPPADGWLDKSMLCAHEEQYPGKYTECKEIIRTYSYSIENYIYDTYYPPEGATHAMVQAAMEEGRVVVNYRGHGDTTYWTWSPDWDVQHTYALQNGAHTPIVWNIACYNGDVTGSTECLSEAWQNAGSSGEGGAVANIGATEPSYTIANHAFDKMLYRAPLDEGITRFGYVVDRGKEHMINEEGQYGVDNAYMYICFGDPALDIPAQTLWTPEASHLPTVSMGGGQFDVTLTNSGAPVENAMVCIMKDDDGLYEVGYTDATGSVSLPTMLTSGGTMTLTITAHNMQPYMADILVQAAGCGAIVLDHGMYNCDQEVIVRVWDSDLNANPGEVETTEVDMSSDSEPTPEVIVLTETGPDTGEFMGSIMTSDTQGGTGYLLVADGDIITGVYHDADCEGSPVDVDDTAGVDCAGPVITDVTIDAISTDFFTVSWTTSELADTVLVWGESTPPGTVVADSGMDTEHEVTLTDLSDCTPYYFYVAGTDAAGNETVDDNGGMYYMAVTYELVIFLEANMDTDPGWTYVNQWAWGAPLGNEGDPSSGYTGANVVGYNLAGDYTNNMPETYCTTQSLDCSEAGEVFLSYYEWLGVESSTWDHASIDVSGNGGSTWDRIWTHTGSSTSGGSWTFMEYDISAIAAGNADVQIRWVMGTTDSSVTYCGWNIDDVLVSYTTECTTVPTPTPTPDCINDGDVTLDGEITAGDAQLAFLVALGSYTPTTEEECAADCNGDGEVTAGDAQAIFLVALGSSPSCADPI